RLWGGIHVPSDDFTGRIIGSQCGRCAWELVRKYFDGSVASSPFALEIRYDTNQCKIRCETVRGFFYKLQSTTNLNEPFTDEPGGFVQAVDSPTVLVENLGGLNKFYRAIRSLAP